MKTAIVTFVRAYNYGAVLQCYALAKALKELSLDVQVIDYFPEYFKKLYTLDYLGPIRRFPYRPLKNWRYYYPLNGILERRNQRFDSFIRNNIPMTQKQYTSFAELDAENMDFDMFISGSDQVWSNRCVPFDPVYFLQFSSTSPPKRFSYAASFGASSIPVELEEEYRSRLKNWGGYSVREKSGLKICEDVLHIKATQCCDPTLLLTRDDWRQLTAVAKKNRPYILVYDVNNSTSLFKEAESLSKEKELPVYILTSNMHHDSLLCRRENTTHFKNYADASPQKWLSLFFSAAYILTDSFHGVVFSLFAQKQFLHISDSPNIRVAELLSSVNLENRYDSKNTAKIDKEINWPTVDRALEEFRTGSLAYLENTVRKQETLL